MTLHHNNGVVYFTFPVLDDLGIIHAFFMRYGGVSSEPWKSLNLATSVGDSRVNVIENRRRITESLGLEQDSIYDVWQVHSNKVMVTTHPRDLETSHKKADAIITDNPQVSLMMLFADCVPIIFYAKNRNLAAIAHAGWQGTVKDIVGNTIEELIQRFLCDPDEIVACIGPAICTNHYPVGIDVIKSIKELFDAETDVGYYKDEQFYLDLPHANELLIRQKGVNQVYQSGICTAENTSDWFSHRGEAGNTGRFAAVMTCKRKIL